MGYNIIQFYHIKVDYHIKGLSVFVIFTMLTKIRNGFEGPVQFFKILPGSHLVSVK